MTYKFWMVSSFILFFIIVFYLLFNIYFSVNTISYTGSMQPYFMGGEVVLNKKIGSIYDINVSDIAVYYNVDSDSYIIHRVLDIDYSNGFVYMKGDNNEFADGWIPFDSFVYKYMFKIIN
jgi:signal peptidase I